ncbi:MAG: hypothetical protein HY459_04235 [Parcubacteria group bacterium]|nr:hypothetical protein [Parcubacteria group bacterium]
MVTFSIGTDQDVVEEIRSFSRELAEKLTQPIATNNVASVRAGIRRYFALFQSNPQLAIDCFNTWGKFYTSAVEWLIKVARLGGMRDDQRPTEPIEIDLIDFDQRVFHPLWVD